MIDRSVYEFDQSNRRGRLSSMLKMDFYRLLHTPLMYIMIAISAFIPAMVLTMTSANEAVDAQTFTNTWQVVESIRGANSGLGFMDLAVICNINMVYIFAAILVSIFISHDYSSGYIKNIFSVHSKKIDYAISKSCAGAFSGALMVLAYFLGSIFAGFISGKSFDLGAASVFNLGICVLSKIALMGLYVPLYTAVAVFFKQRLWLTIIGAFFLGIMFYPVAMMSAPLNSNPMNLIMCIAGGVLIGLAFIVVSNIILSRRDLA